MMTECFIEFNSLDLACQVDEYDKKYVYPKTARQQVHLQPLHWSKTGNRNVHNFALVPILIHQQKARHPAQNISEHTVAHYVEAQRLGCPLLASSHACKSLGQHETTFPLLQGNQLLLSRASSPFGVQDRHKYTCVLSSCYKSQWRAPSRPKDGASKRVLPALLNVNGSNYSVFQPPPVPLSALQVQLSPPQTRLRP